MSSSDGFFPLPSVYCLAWICLDVLFCTASIMHLCTISVDRYLSLRYPMKFGRNKTRRRVTLKIVFVWILSIAMSLPLSLMYSQDHTSVLVEGNCQIPDPLYKLIGSIICFYIPLGVMLLTYALTVRLLAVQQQNLGGGGAGWSSGWMGGPTTPSLGLERRCTWRRLLLSTKPAPSTPQHQHSAASTDTDLTTLDTHELWLPDTAVHEPAPCAMSALHQFGAEMLRLSRGLENVASVANHGRPRDLLPEMTTIVTTRETSGEHSSTSESLTESVLLSSSSPYPVHACHHRRRRAHTIHEPREEEHRPLRRSGSLHEPGRRRPSDSDTDTDESGGDDDDDDEEPPPAKGSTWREQLVSSGYNEMSDDDEDEEEEGKADEVDDEPGEKTTMLHAKSSKRRGNVVVEEDAIREWEIEEKPKQPPADVSITEPDTGTEFLHKCQVLQEHAQGDDDSSKEIANNKDTPYGTPLKNHHVCEKEMPDDNQYKVCMKDGNNRRIEVALPNPCRPPTKVHRKDCGGEQRRNEKGTRRARDDTNTSFPLPPPCTCPYFGETNNTKSKLNAHNTSELVIVPTGGAKLCPGPAGDADTSSHRPKRILVTKTRTGEAATTSNMIVTWEAAPKPRLHRRGSSFNALGGGGGGGGGRPLRRAATVKNNGVTTTTTTLDHDDNLLARYGGSGRTLNHRQGTVRSHHSRTSSVISRTSSRHGRILRLEQKATKVLGVVFFTFVILWAPFFVLNLLPSVCAECERNIDQGVFDFVTWLGYASSMVNPIFYTIFNKVFRQAFKKVLMCKYRNQAWRPSR